MLSIAWVLPSIATRAESTAIQGLSVFLRLLDAVHHSLKRSLVWNQNDRSIPNRFINLFLSSLRFAFGCLLSNVLLFLYATGCANANTTNKRRHMFSATGAGVLMKWLLPGEAHGPNVSTAVFGGGNNSNVGVYRLGAGGSNGSKIPRMDWIGGERLYALTSRFAFVGVCYDEGADTVSAVSKHGTVVVAQGIPGLRL